MRKLILLALAVVPVLVLSAPAAAQKPRCRAAAASRIIERTHRVLVYKRDDSVIACQRPNGRRWFLGTDDGLYNLVTIDAVTNRTVTYTVDYTPECKADCPPGVSGGHSTHRIDLRTGKQT
jgi:hypothetical protein